MEAVKLNQQQKMRIARKAGSWIATNVWQEHLVLAIAQLLEQENKMLRFWECRSMAESMATLELRMQCLKFAR